MPKTKPRRVLKFGGTSVGTAHNLQKALGILDGAADEGAPLTVVSALSGVTDQLAALVQGTGRGLDARRSLSSLRERHLALLAAVASGPARRDGEKALASVLARLFDALARIANADDRDPALADEALAAGERLAVPIVVAALRARGRKAEAVDGTEVVRTDGRHGGAEVDFEASRERLRGRLALLPEPCVPVVTGFVAGTDTGRTTVLGRGGSDYTAAILGAALPAERVEIWTDVDGILSADPDWVEDTSTLNRLSYLEADFLARAGARILHPKTVPPLAQRRIPIYVGNTLRAEIPGTWILAEGTGSEPRPALARAVTSIVHDGQATLGVLPGERRSGPDLLRKIGAVLAEAGLRASPAPEQEPGGGPRVLVPAEQRVTAVRVLHAALVRPTGRSASARDQERSLGGDPALAHG